MSLRIGSLFLHIFFTGKLTVGAEVLCPIAVFITICNEVKDQMQARYLINRMIRFYLNYLLIKWEVT